jgi:hypothetical protein
MFPVTLTLHNAADLAAVMAALSVQPAERAKDTAPAKPTRPSAREAAPAATQAPTAEPTPAPTPAPTAAPAPTAPTAQAEPAAAPGAKAVSYDDIKVLIPKAVAKAGRDKVLALLGEFGAKAGPEIKPEHFAAVHAKLQVLAS